MKTSKPRILSGIQPSGRLHVGNYLGALKNFVELQNSDKYECFFMLADYHSITEDYDPKEKPRQILELAADFLAAGLDPKRSTIFLQSLVPEHTELAWIFSTVTAVAELTRMTQYKDKASRQAKNINAGLFTYPILQAVDILIYKPVAVPVGADQLQHLELANDIARKFNRKFGQTFAPVKAELTPAPRVMSLTDPTKKMSKSEAAGCLFLDDSPAEIAAKLARAVTDTAPEGQTKSPGVANLFLLLDAFGTAGDLQRFEAEFESKKIRYSELKAVIADRVAQQFKDYRERKSDYQTRPTDVKKILMAGSSRAQEIASTTLAEVKQKIGLGF